MKAFIFVLNGSVFAVLPQEGSKGKWLLKPRTKTFKDVYSFKSPTVFNKILKIQLCGN